MKTLLQLRQVKFELTDGFTCIKNPATFEPIAYVYDTNEKELLDIIKKSQIAQKIWAKRSALERADILWRWYRLLLENKEMLAHILTLEQGKPLTESRGEIAYAASFIRFFAEEARRTNGDIIPSVHKHQRLLVIKQPIGVCAAITPWNFPSAMITRKAAPALGCGCSMIVKPASQTPLSAYALANLAYEAGIPEDLFQVVTGNTSRIGNTLCASDMVRKISFTGSTEIGRLLMKQSAQTIKKLSLELGGNAPFIVFDDACLATAVAGIMLSKFRNSGQTCVCANRIYVQDKIYDKLSALLGDAVKNLQVGNGLEEGITQGPLIDEKAVIKVEKHIEDALDKGGKILTGGNIHTMGGNFFEPTLLINATQDMLVAKEETFGPLAPLFKFETEEEVVAMANDTEFGLAAYLYTNDAARQWRVAEALEYGMVGINTGMISNEVAPFGGIKQSGLGREGASYGMDEYLELKYMCIDLGEK